MLVLGLLLLYKITMTIGFKAFFSKYRIELLLLAAYFAVCFISLYLNHWRYKDSQQLIRYGVTFIVISGAFPTAIFLFVLPSHKRGLSLTTYLRKRKIPVAVVPLVFMLLVAAMGLSQNIFPELYASVSQFFIAGESGSNQITRSIFRISTDFASICAIVGSVLLLFVLANNNKLFRRGSLLVLFCASMCLLAGVVSGKRIFVLTIIVAAVIGACYLYRHKPMRLLTGLLFILLASHLIILLGPELLVTRMESIFPYIGFLIDYQLPPLESLTIDFQQEGFGGRLKLWSTAINVFNDNPFFGVSNGGFRLENRLVEQNTHNMFLQILVDGGIFGMIIILALLASLITRCQSKVLALVVIVFMLGSLQVDYFIDHSMPWVIIVAYFCMWFWSFCSKCEYEGLNK